MTSWAGAGISVVNSGDIDIDNSATGGKTKIGGKGGVELSSSAAGITLSDSYRAGSTYSTAIPLSSASSEWSAFESNFGEVSLLAAVNLAYDNGTQNAGAIRQVVTGTSTTEVIADTASYEDLGVSATITPASSSNKVLVTANLQYYATRTSSSVGFGIQIKRGSTVVYESYTTTVALGFFQNAGSAASIASGGVYTVVYEDSPATTSALTYSVFAKPSNSANSGQVAFQSDGSATDGRSTIVLCEVVP